MKTRTDKINEIIVARKEKAGEIAALQRWMWDARTALAAFREAISSPDSPAASVEATAELIARSSAIESELVSDSAALEKVRSHFAKDTLAVAVVGQAGMGKSTFLQSLTGLSDAQIPASGGRACTSTQSRIDNLAGGPGYAEIFYYSRAEMLGILSDCYSLLKWPAPSFRSIEDFVQDFDSREKPSETALESLWRLLKTYRENATELEREIFLPNLRSKRIRLEDVAKSVTYSEGESRPENLGISRVEIHCAFPSKDVGKLSVVDTPGMNAASEDRDKIILERVLDETADFVLFVGIPAERGISQKEREMFDNCRRCARQVSDVVLDQKAFYVANQAVVRDSRTGEIRRNGADPEYNALWKQDFDNGVIPAKRLLAVNVKDSEAVRNVVLDPMIDYLVENLPGLDGKELSGAQSKVSSFRDRISQLAIEARKSLGLNRTIDQDGYRKLRELFDAFFPHFSGSLTRFVDQKVPSESEDGDQDEPANPFVKKVSEVFLAYRDEIGQALSLEAVQFEMDRLPGQGGAAFYNLLSHLRCRVRDCFSGIEDACREMVENAKREVSSIFVDSLPPEGKGGGLGGVSVLKNSDGTLMSGSEFFQGLAGICREATGTTGCRMLAKQFKAFADFELKFSGFLEHRVSAALSPLRQGSCNAVLNGLPDFSSAEKIRSALLALGDEAVNRVACALAEKSATEPEQAIFAVLENFVDRTLRTQGMEKEWLDFYEVVRAEVWPDVFDPNSTINLRVSKLREYVDALSRLAQSSSSR